MSDVHLSPSMKTVMQDVRDHGQPYRSFHGTSRGNATQALRRLIDAGLVCERRGGFVVTRKGLSTEPVQLPGH